MGLHDLLPAAPGRRAVRCPASDPSALLIHENALDANSLLLLTIPFPANFLNRGIVKFGDVVFSVRVGTLSVFSIITTISFIVLAGK